MDLNVRLQIDAYTADEQANKISKNEFAEDVILDRRREPVKPSTPWTRPRREKITTIIMKNAASELEYTAV